MPLAATLATLVFTLATPVVTLAATYAVTLVTLVVIVRVIATLLATPAFAYGSILDCHEIVSSTQLLYEPRLRGINRALATL